MEKMHKQRNEFKQNDKENVETIFLSTSIIKPTTEVIAETPANINIDSERTLSECQESVKKIRNSKHNCEASNKEIYTGTTTSCTSSTDSGVNVSDNDDIPSLPPPTSRSRGKAIPVNQFKKQFHNNTDPDKNVNKQSNNNCIHNTSIIVDNQGCDGDENNSTNFNKELKSRMQQQKITQHLQTVDNYSSDAHERYQANQNYIEGENAKKVSQQRNLITAATPNNENQSLQRNGYINQQNKSISTPPSPSVSSSFSASSANISEIHPSNCKSSPVFSIRSICSSTIITSDSDSDVNDDIEGVHENYVIKKLGTQVTFPPKHPEIPNINSGHKLLNQKVQTVGDIQQPSPLAALAAIGDTFGQAQALGAAPSAAQRPQIGSIALSNSSDVTFGDKHFYEGPVTIQQFLIDSRDKWKENGKDNPTFVNDNSETPNNAKDIINSSSAKSGKIYDCILKRKRVFIPGVLAIAALLIVGTIFGVLQNESTSKLILGNNEESRKNIPINSTIAQDNVGGGYVLRIVPRDGWLAQPPINPWIRLNLPINRVIVIPTRTAECETQAACTYTVRITQTFNIESQQQDDIIYNFLIGGDGNVYEGRGWDNRGSVIKGFNDDSISFAYIGLFKKQPPSYKQLNVTKLLLEEGVRLKKLSSDYKIVGAHSLDPTSVLTSADALYKSFENWPHWSDK